MIPIRLELKNFMSYGEDVPTIDFAGMHLICLSGENGHGKSALLDAITWSLWGESRAGKNKHDELVRIGADEMSVHFTFEMDGQCYRVVRKRSKKAGGNLWELQQETPDSGLGSGWRSLTGNTAGETEKAIQKLLRMSYDLFVNSAYLRQGQADLFIKQTATKRKEILADILDLSRYDQLEAKAREQAKTAQAEAVDLERDISGIDAELKFEPEMRATLTDLEARSAALKVRYEELKAEWDTLRDLKNSLEEKQQRAETLNAQSVRRDAEFQDTSLQIAEQKASVDIAQALLARRSEIDRDFQSLLAVRKSLGPLEVAWEQFRRGEQRLAALDKEWMAAQNAAQLRRERAVRDHEDALAAVQDYELLREQRAQIAPRVAEADHCEAQVPEAQRALKTVQEQFAQLKEENGGLDWQVKDWKRKQDALGQQQGVCDVCNTPLPPARVAAIEEDYEAALAEALARQKDVRTEAGRVKQEVAQREAALRGLEAQGKAARPDRTRLAQIEQSLFRMEETQKDIPNLQAVREDAERVYSAAAFAPEVRSQILTLEAGLKKLAGAEADYAAARAETARLEPSERLHIELEHAQAMSHSAEAALIRLRKSLASIQQDRDEIQAQLAAIADVTPELEKLEKRRQEIKTQVDARNAEDTAVSQEIGRRQATLARLEEQKLVRAEKAKRLTDAQYTREVHEKLTQAFGKKGVQALIIENAIPELQEEANRLLDRLTDGDMSLFFETLRESKTKREGPIETLDIKVSDNLGTRPLEMYSGGEGFRAAFALRIALSKLLTRRAGARLQTLIIDEGFGSQDAKGREKLIDCLNAIKDDFERIIVITHIDEMKDAFATRIEVSKSPSGSQISVLEGSAG